MNRQSDAALGTSATEEWDALVTAAVLGTDRRPPPPPGPGWESPVPSDDPAVELLDRAATVATARRAGLTPLPVPARLEPAPHDPRPACPPAAAALLATMLAGRHDVAMPEWFALCRAGGYRLPAHLLPAMLMRGRRLPAFDAVVRELAGPLAAWLADAMPELRVRTTAAPVPATAEPFAPPLRPIDSGAVVSAIIDTFHDRSASWAAVGQLRVSVAALDPTWLQPLMRELDRLPFHTVTERTKVELHGLAQLRTEMARALAPVAEASGTARAPSR